MSRVPHWAASGGPFSKLYRGPWFFYWKAPPYARGWRLGIGHRMGGFYLVELGPLRIGRHVWKDV